MSRQSLKRLKLTAIACDVQTNMLVVELFNRLKQQFLALYLFGTSNVDNIEVCVLIFSRDFAVVVENNTVIDDVHLIFIHLCFINEQSGKTLSHRKNTVSLS